MKYPFEKCKEIAKKYNCRSDFKKNDLVYYNSALRNKWLDEICSHMKKIGNRYYRCIYLWKFEDNSVYIGLTYNYEKRMEEHLYDIKSPVFKHLNISNGVSEKLTDYIYKDEAKNKEKYFINYYKEKGFNVLNKDNGGGLGHYVYDCSDEECIQIALTCKTKAEFQKKYKRYYNYSLTTGLYDKLFDHLTYEKKDNNFWTKERCHEIALLCKNNKEFETNYNSIYVTSRKKRWYKDITKHFIEIKKPNNFWTIERSIEYAKTCKNKSTLKKKYYQAYFVLKNNNLLDNIFEKKILKVWTKENCQKEALKYNSRGEFQKKSKCAYSKAINKKWLDEICSHMKYIRKQN